MFGRGVLRHRVVVVFVALAGAAVGLSAGGALGSSRAISGRYLLTFQACDPKLGPVPAGGTTFTCPQPPTQHTYLAQSEDGVTWSLVPGWSSPLGFGVADVIRRGDTIYVYGNLDRRAFELDVYRLSVSTGKIVSSSRVDIAGLSGPGPIEPSLIQGADGSLVLFFDQQGNDPYQNSSLCTNHGSPPGASCETHILSATEVAGSDGAGFRLDPGVRAAFTLSHGTWGGDPDVFSDGATNFLTVAASPDAGVLAFSSTDLHGTYTRLSSLVPDGPTGCCAAGYFDPGNRSYWTYVHGRSAGPGSPGAIKRAVSSDLAHPLSASDFVQVLPTAQVLPGYDTSEPSFAANDPGLPAPTGGSPTKATCEVPNVVGESVAAARSALAAAHCRAGAIRHAPSARVGKGKVLSQRPAAGARRAGAAKVDLVVGVGSRR